MTVRLDSRVRFFQGLEDLFGDGGFGDDALDGAGAVAEDGEEELARGAEVVEPAAEGDGLAFVLADGGYGGEGYLWFGHIAGLPCSRLPDCWDGAGGGEGWPGLGDSIGREAGFSTPLLTMKS